MFWVYYRSETDVTPEYVAKLVDHYYVQNKTEYFGDGNREQLVANPQFETLAGWTLKPGVAGEVGRFRYDAVPNLQNDHDAHGWSSHKEHGLRMIRGRTANHAAFEISNLNPGMVYTVSAWVMADKPGRSAGLRIVQADGRIIAQKDINRAGRGTQWNEWSRILFQFTTKATAVRIELDDRQSSAGAILYWDFVELESVFPVAGAR